MRTYFFIIAISFTSLIYSQSNIYCTNNQLSNTSISRLINFNDTKIVNNKTNGKKSILIQTASSEFTKYSVNLALPNNDTIIKKNRLKNALILSGAGCLLGSALFGSIAFSPGGKGNTTGMNPNKALATAAVLGWVGAALIVIPLKID